jgi:hypothetical protein
MHGHLGNFKKRSPGLVSRSFACACAFSLIGLAISAVMLAMTAPQALDEILTRLE